MRVNVALRQYRKAYADYWASTAALTGTGEPVDAFIMPVAPFPAPRRGRYPDCSRSFPCEWGLSRVNGVGLSGANKWLTL